jgi:hypothetical protein
MPVVGDGCGGPMRWAIVALDARFSSRLPMYVTNDRARTQTLRMKFAAVASNKLAGETGTKMPLR